jgi:two-component system chemotaxis sensor kinase CheA
MDRDQLIQRLMATFLEELEEHVAALNRDLLALEKEQGGPRQTEHLKTLFRTVHSLKGAARSVSVPLLEAACHRLEEILAAARDGRRPLDAGLFPLLFETADAIEEAGMWLREQHDLASAPLARLLPQLEAAAAEAGEAPPSRPPAPPPRQEKAPPPPAAPAPPGAPAESGGGTAVVRLPAEKLDALLTQSGELLVARRRLQARGEDLDSLHTSLRAWRREWHAVEKALAGLLLREADPQGGQPDTLPPPALRALRGAAEHLRHLERDVDRLGTDLATDHRALKQAHDTLDQEVRRARLFPFAEACEGLDRVVRDLARAGGKEVELTLEGGSVELDRSVLEGLKDPLRHLVRNAVDHGAEPPERRRASGKPARARVTVSAVLRGGQVEVAVADDGRGLDLDALRQQARRRGLAEPADERDLARLIFLPGLSTAAIITDVSGRGVGLDVVKSRVEALHGTVDVAFTPGHGTRFTLTVPLTLTTLRAILVGAGGQTFALVGTQVERLLRIDPAELRSVEGREVATLGGSPIPVASLAGTLGLTAGRPAAAGARVPAVIVTAGDRRVAFVVEELVAEQAVVVKNLGARIRRLRHVSAATILPSGQIALVLNGPHLVRTALGQAGRPLAAAPAGPAAPVRKRILVADDSLTTRTLEKSILEAAGYDVLTAADGQAAWQLLHERGADLLVSDVEMPRMDGFVLAEAVRGSARFGKLPVVLVSARESDQDRARGIAVGADAYLGKSAFDQRNLLETIAQLL